MFSRGRSRAQLKTPRAREEKVVGRKSLRENKERSTSTGEGGEDRDTEGGGAGEEGERMKERKSYLGARVKLVTLINPMS